MKITKTIYKCDVCEKEFSDEKDIIPTPVLVRGIDGEGRITDNLCEKTVDMCKACRKMYYDTVSRLFAEFTEEYYGGVDVKKK